MKKRNRTLHYLFLFSLLLSTVLACNRANQPIATSDNDFYWPTEDWQTANPSDHGIDNSRLEKMFTLIDDQNINLHSLLIVKDGYIVAEKYYDEFDENTPHVQYSVTKSFTSALIGIALEDGTLSDVDQKVVDFFPDLLIDRSDEWKNSITIEDVLTMRAGLDWTEGNSGYVQLMEAADATTYMLTLPMYQEPGTGFRYCSGCSYLLSAILQESANTNTLTYAKTHLFEPLGIQDVTWEKLQNSVPNGGWGLFLTPRQMAKFGYLYLNNGQWEGRQVIPSAWVEASTAPGRYVDEYVDYGYQWWIYKDLGVFAAQGLYGQKIYVIPDLQMIVVMTAELYDERPEYILLTEYILPAAVQE